MQVIHKCRNLLNLRNLINISSTQFANLHTTAICCDKRKNKGKSDFKGAQQPSKNHVRLAIRQKRADTKRAIKGLLSHYGDQGTTFENDEPWKRNGTKSCDTDSTKKKRKSEHKRAEKIHNHRMRREYRKKSLNKNHDDYPETIFEATYGGRFYTWSFDSWNGTSRRSSPQFDWRDMFRGRPQEWDTAYKSESQDEGYNVGLPADRVALGLSPKGPLKMKDVKTAFHLSALKWHPDKHQGPTQAAAEEKFKVCVSAYKSLCSALSGA
ncbi:hypothetical protein vseg_005112 [Gypsophila vaccaria]